MKDTKIKIRSRVLLITGMILLITVTFSRCRKDDLTMPAGTSFTVVPADKGSVDPSATTDLKWSNSGSNQKYNIYFGEKPVPDLYKSGYSSQVLNVPVAGGHTYYWKIGTITGSGTEQLSPVYSFKVKVILDIDKFTGVFVCSEPRYTSYDVSAVKIAKDTLEIDNFWDLKWKIKYAFDNLGNVKIIPTTFYPDPKLSYMVSGAGTFDNEKNEFKVNYTITQKVTGETEAYLTDQNVHSFVKK